MDANAAAAASVAAASASSVPQGFFGAAGAMNPMLNPMASINPMLAQMMANMPGAASANPMILAQLLAQQAAAAAGGGGANSVAAQQLSRKSRELYVGNIPLGTVNNQGLKEFFDTACEAAFGTDPQGFKPVVKAEINANGTFAFVEVHNLRLFCCPVATGLAGSLRTLPSLGACSSRNFAGFQP